MSASSLAISSRISAMRALSSVTDNNVRSCPISWAIFFFGRSSSSIAGMRRLPSCKISPRIRGCHTNRRRLNRRRKFKDRAMSDIPAQMTAIGIKEAGSPEMLEPQQRPVPKPGAGEILVKVRAAGVNRPDVMQRKGLYPPPPGAPDIPGLEICGDVVALGQGATRWKTGDRVMALVVG